MNSYQNSYMKRSRKVVYLMYLIALILITGTISAFAQETMSATRNEAPVTNKYRISLPTIILPQLATTSWDDRTHTQHFELHIKRNLDNKNIIGVKLATWRLFQPMGIVWWDGLLDKIETESEFYPGHVRESGIGISYQRMLWKGLFTTVEVLPQYKPIWIWTIRKWVMALSFITPFISDIIFHSGRTNSSLLNLRFTHSFGYSIPIRPTSLKRWTINGEITFCLNPTCTSG